MPTVRTADAPPFDSFMRLPSPPSQETYILLSSQAHRPRRASRTSLVGSAAYPLLLDLHILSFSVKSETPPPVLLDSYVVSRQGRRPFLFCFLYEGFGESRPPQRGDFPTQPNLNPMSGRAYSDFLLVHLSCPFRDPSPPFFKLHFFYFRKFALLISVLSVRRHFSSFFSRVFLPEILPKVL